MAIILNVFIEAAQGREEELAGLLKELVGPTRSEPGCVSYELNASQEKPGAFLFYEKFADQAALDAHVGSPHFQSFLKKREASDPIASQSVTRWSALA
jgi:quinol monooxygenase YgiN